MYLFKKSSSCPLQLHTRKRMCFQVLPFMMDLKLGLVDTYKSCFNYEAYSLLISSVLNKCIAVIACSKSLNKQQSCAMNKTSLT